MTVEEVVKAALGRLRGVTDGRSLPRPTLYERIGRRQQQLYAKMSQADQEYAGTWADGDLDANQRLDLRDLVDPLPMAGRITRIEVKDRGSASQYGNGQEVNIVTVTNAEFVGRPRVTVRDGILEGWLGRQTENDLKGVASLRVYYPLMPAALGATDKDTDIMLEEPWTELLVLDLAMFMVRRAPGLDPGSKQMALQEVAAEHTELAGDFDDHIRRLRTRVGVTPMVF